MNYSKKILGFILWFITTVIAISPFVLNIQERSINGRQLTFYVLSGAPSAIFSCIIFIRVLRFSYCRIHNLILLIWLSLPINSIILLKNINHEHSKNEWLLMILNFAAIMLLLIFYGFRSYKISKSYRYRYYNEEQREIKYLSNFEYSRDVVNLRFPEKFNWFTNIKFPKECQIDKSEKLSFQLTIKKKKESVLLKVIEILFPDNKDTVILLVAISANNFLIEKSLFKLAVKKYTNTKTIHFNLTPKSLGEQFIEIEIYNGAERISFLSLKTTVKKRKINSSDAKINTYEKLPTSLKHNFGVFSSSHRSIKINRTIRVICKNDEISFSIYMDDNQIKSFKQSRIPQRESIASFLEQLSTLIYNISRVKYAKTDDELSCLANIKGIGQFLCQQIIPNELLAEIKEWSDNEVICISTDEQWIPWEILNDGNAFFNERFLLFRLARVNSDRIDIPTKISENNYANSDKILHIIGGEIPELDVNKAKKVFSEFGKGFNLQTLERQSVNAIMKASSKADILHFTCHGYTSPLYLHVAKYPDLHLNLSPVTLYNSDFIIKDNSVVFSNACNSSTTDIQLDNFISFGWEFYRKGASVFIGTLGTIPNEFAIHFSHYFYKALFNGDKVGIAFKKAKDKMKEENNFHYLLYCLYGNINSIKTYYHGTKGISNIIK